MYKEGDDVKLKLAVVKDGAAVDPLEVPFEIRVWTDTPQECAACGWTGERFYGGCSVRDGYVIVAMDDPGFVGGLLTVEVEMMYPDDDMADGVRVETKRVRLEAMRGVMCPGVVEWDAIVTHEVVGLSAYKEAVRRGFAGTVEEWLASLKGKAAEIASQAEDAEGNTVITWADGKTTTVKRGKEGRPGEPGKDGKDGGINIPRFYIEEGEDGRKHLYCEVPEAGDIRVYTKDVEGRKHLILEF